MTKTATATTAENLEERFDAGEDVLDYFDPDSAVHPLRDYETKSITVTLPLWLIATLDEEASRRGMTRKGVINMWLVDRADEERAHWSRQR